MAANKILLYQVEIYDILKKYGQYLRKQIRKKKYKEIAIGVTTYDGIGIRCVLPSHAKVRELRSEVRHKLNSPLMVHLELFERRLDDDEYLIDCGCNPRTVNEITTVYLMPGEREIEIPQNTPDDNEEVPILLTSSPSVLQQDNQVPIQSPTRREMHRETTQSNRNMPQRANELTLD